MTDPKLLLLLRRLFAIIRGPSDATEHDRLWAMEERWR